MTPVELLARLAALIPPPRYPLVRYSGVLAPRSSWRKYVVPKPRVTGSAKRCESPGAPTAARGAAGERAPSPDARPDDRRTAGRGADSPRADAPSRSVAAIRQVTPVALAAADRHAHVELLAPNVLSVKHWERLLGGALYAAAPRIDWATLLRRTFSVDVLECKACGGRLRVLGSVTERDTVRAVLERLAMPLAAPSVARAREPTDHEQVEEADGG